MTRRGLIGVALLAGAGLAMTPSRMANDTPSPEAPASQRPADAASHDGTGMTPTAIPEGAGASRNTARGLSFHNLDPQFTAFLDAGYGEIPIGDRHQEDAFLRSLLTSKMEALQALEAAYTELATGTDDAWAVNARVRLGEVYLEMARWLSDMPHPTYLSSAQSRVYQLALNDKARAQSAHAVQAIESARTRMPADDPRKPYVETLLRSVDKYDTP